MAASSKSTSPGVSTGFWFTAIGVTLLSTGLVFLALFRFDLAAAGGFIASDAARETWRLHAPDLAPILQAGLAIQIHVAAVVAAAAIGAYLLAGPKGNIPHRTLGWAWVIFMITGAASSFFVMEQNPGHFSFLHGFSAFVLVMAPLGVMLARRHLVRSHSLPWPASISAA